MDFKLPHLGENIETAEVIGLRVAVGDVVAAEQPLIELETDKATVEVPSPVAGRIEQVLCKVGDEIKVGQRVFVIAESAGAGAPVKAASEQAPATAAPEATAPKAAAGPAPSAPVAVSRPSGATVLAGPATRKLARELGVDLGRVTGSAPHGRVSLEDVKEFVKANMTAGGGAAGRAEPGLPSLPDFSVWGPVERQPLTGIRRKIAENLALAWRHIPMVTQHDEADVTDLEAGRKRFGKQLQATEGDRAPKITMTVILVKAVVAALKKLPQFNASLDLAANGGKGELVLKRHFHIGIAVDTEHGLVVPVLRNADRKGLVELARELEDLSSRARIKKLAPDEMKGATFTITNLGGIGGTSFSPIVSWPEVAILGVARSQQKMVVREGKPEVRLLMPLCLTYDHRIIDGADGARFVTYLAQVLGDPIVLMMGG